MASIDELFKSAGTSGGKRKFEANHDPAQYYKSAKVSSNGDVKGHKHAAAEEANDDNDVEAGPALPAPDGEELGPEDEEGGRFFGGGVSKNTADVLDYIEEQDQANNDAAPEKVDIAWVRRAGISLERKITKNAELRSKFEDSPEKFMGSEADLDAEIKTLSILSEHPELYEEFAKLGCVRSLVSLLAHENTDIAIDAIEILSELTAEDLEASSQQWDTLVNAALEADLLDLLAQNFARFDEANDSDRSGVYHSLSVIENLASSPEISTRMCTSTKIVSWLLARARAAEVTISQNKQYAAEILAILLQSSPANQEHFLTAFKDGMDALLQILAPYRKRDPEKDSEEEEFVENLFDALSCLVDTYAGKTQFVEAEGIELALIMLREGKFSRPRALRLLDHAAGGQHSMAVCERIVEAAGLKTIFGMLTKKQTDNTAIEHLLGIIASLLRHLPVGSAARIRTLAKLCEKEWQTTRRILQLRTHFLARLRPVEARIREERQATRQEDRPAKEDDWFGRRLDAGLFCLQTVDIILAWVVAEDDGARGFVEDRLGEEGLALGDVRATLEERVREIDGAGAGAGAASEEESLVKDMLATLIEFLRGD